MAILLKLYVYALGDDKVGSVKKHDGSIDEDGCVQKTGAVDGKLGDCKASFYFYGKSEPVQVASLST